MTSTLPTIIIMLTSNDGARLVEDPYINPVQTLSIMYLAYYIINPMIHQMRDTIMFKL